jgi:hypothetical protein
MFKRMVQAVSWATVLSVLLIARASSARNLSPDDDIVGRWDMTIQEASGSQYPSWFEATREGGTLKGRYVGRTGSQLPMTMIEFENGHLAFAIQFDPRTKFEAQLTGKRLEGTVSGRAGQALKWTAVRAPKLDRKSTPRWGKPITLFNGRELTGWKPRDPTKAATWQVVEGAMENLPHGTDIFTEQKFTDFKLHVEFKMAEKSNSGVYLRGRYEVQIQDDFGKEPESHRVGGIYGFITPSSNPAKKAGEWQTYDITFVGRRVTVVFNDKVVIDNAEIPGLTGGAIDSNEGEPGPIMLQGDHEKIYYRNIVITPAK